MNGSITDIAESPTIEPRWLMPLVDIVLVFVAFTLAYVIRYEWQIIRPVFDPTRAEFAPYLPYTLFYAIMLYVIYQGNGLYKNFRGRALMEEVTLIANGATAGTVILLALYYMFQPLVTSRLMLIYVVSLTVILLSLARLLRRIWLSYLRGKGIGIQRVLIVGMSQTGQAVLGVMVSRRELGYRVVGYLDDNPERGEVDLGRVHGLGKLDNLATSIAEHQVDTVVITLRWKHYDRIQELARICRKAGVAVRVVPDIFQLNMRQVQVENLDGIPLLGVQGVPAFRGAGRLFKRVMDVSLTLLTFPVWGMAFLIIAIAMRLEGKGDIFYRQRRVGENGREFFMVKFRSMIPDADKYHQELVATQGQDPKGGKIENDPRITRVGKFLRRTSLDELPNLLNVLKGEMSLVGPRPPMPDEVDHYEAWHKQRLQIIPGMTGLWQVSGRSDVPFDEMCLMDIYYIENWSIKFDIQILMMTIPRVLMRSGAY